MVKKPLKNFRTVLDGKLVRELLSAAPEPPPEPLDEDTCCGSCGRAGAHADNSLGARLSRAVEVLADVVEEANTFLSSSEISRHLAMALAAEKSKRGAPYILVSPAGEVVLEISYDGKQPKDEKKRRKYKRGLPLLGELRKEAEELGVSVTHLGQKRRAVYDYLQEVKSRQEATEEDDPAQMAAGHDEVTVSQPKDGPKPPRKRVKLVTPGTQQPESTEPVAKASANLTRLLEQSEDLDIEDILSDNGS